MAQGEDDAAPAPPTRDPRARPAPAQAGPSRGEEGGRPRRGDQQPRDDAPAGRETEVPDEPLARRGGPGEDGAAPAPLVRAPRQTPHRGAGALQLTHVRRVRLARDEAHPRPHHLRGLRTHRRPRHERRGERPSLGTNERGRAGPGRLQPGGLSPARVIPRPAVPGAAGKPWARSGPCEAGARQAPGSTESTGLLSSSASAGILSIRTDFVLTHIAQPWGELKLSTYDRSRFPRTIGRAFHVRSVAQTYRYL